MYKILAHMWTPSHLQKGALLPRVSGLSEKEWIIQYL